MICLSSNSLFALTAQVNVDSPRNYRFHTSIQRLHFPSYKFHICRLANLGDLSNLQSPRLSSSSLHELNLFLEATHQNIILNPGIKYFYLLASTCWLLLVLYFYLLALWFHVLHSNYLMRALRFHRTGHESKATF